MSEVVKPNGGELTFFQFVCPLGRISEVKALFQEKQLGSLNPELRTETQVWVNPESEEDTYVSGVSIEGIGLLSKQAEILNELADRQIAGYSRETQIIYLQSETIVWKQE